MNPNAPAGDFVVFRNHCVFLRSLSLHQRLLFEEADPQQTDRMRRTAEIFFGDLSQLLVEHIVLQVCKITDPARDVQKNENLTVDFLLELYGLQSDARLSDLRDRLKAFRKKILPARHKLISHSDRRATLAGVPLGKASKAEWDEFWGDLGDFLRITGIKVLGDDTFQLDDVGILSDVDGLLKALMSADMFDQLLGHPNPVVANAAADLALGRARP